MVSTKHGSEGGGIIAEHDTATARKIRLDEVAIKRALAIQRLVQRGDFVVGLEIPRRRNQFWLAAHIWGRRYGGQACMGLRGVRPYGTWRLLLADQIEPGAVTAQGIVTITFLLPSVAQDGSATDRPKGRHG